MSKVTDASLILEELDLPAAQLNERTALCLLALLNLTEAKPWSSIERPMMGITPIMQFVKEAYGRDYAANTRESIRKQSIHQLVAAGLVLLNPDNPQRPINSPKTVYQIEQSAFELLQTYRQPTWDQNLIVYTRGVMSLTERYAKERDMQQIPVKTDGGEIKLSPGDHSLLIKSIIEEFGSRFVPGGVLVYAGDTGAKWGYFNQTLLDELGVTMDSHGKMPDVILHYPEKNWLLLIEAVTSHGPVDGKRHDELSALFAHSTAPLVYVTAFPTRSVMAAYLPDIAWETEVWCADAPTHLIHFNGIRFLGPYKIK
jgi:hypothetical protein